jgi:acyl-CoA thioesterase II
MTPALRHLLDLLQLERLEQDLFRGTNPGDPEVGRVFGGQVAAQALQAATATVDADHRVHSVRANFLRPGRYGLPIVHRVDRSRDGRSFTTRQVAAIQQGETILALTASFHADEDGPEHQLPLPTGVPAPEDVARADDDGFPHRRPFDVRELEPPATVDGRPGAATRRIWIRTDGPIPDDATLHAAVVTYLTDMGPVGAARKALIRAGHDLDLIGASLDHAVWFHRPARADEWLLYDLESVVLAGARGLSRGTLSTRDGRLVASVTQEVLLRVRRS